MTPRHTTHGNSRPWLVATSYKHESAPHARFERDEPTQRNWSAIAFWIVLAVAVYLSFNHAARTDAQATCGGGFEHEGC